MLTLSITVSAQLSQNSEQIYATESHALKQIFTHPNSITKKELTLSPEQITMIEGLLGWSLTQTHFSYYLGKKNNQNTVAFIINELGKHEPMTLMIAVNIEITSKIDSLVMLVYREAIGSEVRKKRFLRQFIQKTLHHPIAVDQDITGITGATVSSWSVAAAVRKALALSECLVQHTQLANTQ